MGVFERTFQGAGLAVLVALAMAPAGGCLLELEGTISPGTDSGSDPGLDTALDVTVEDDTTVPPDGPDAPSDTVPSDSTDVMDATDAADTSPDPVDPPADDAAGEPDAPPCDGPMTVWYVDADGDGYGDLGGGMDSCTRPPGFVGNHDDCMDTNANVHPNQPDYFPMERGDGSFDYDCDGVETALHTATTECFDWSCDGSGWYAGVPYCGQGGLWRTCTWEWLWCVIDEVTVQQLCK